MPMSEFWAVVSNPLIARALVVGALISLCAAMLGVVLVLKRFALIGHGLGEVGFAAVAIAMAADVAPMAVAIPAVVAAGIFIMWLNERAHTGGDAAIGMVATAALAVGVLVSSLSSGFKNDVYNYMFGSLYGISAGDVWLSVALSSVVIALFLLFFHRIFAVTYDEIHAQATGVNVRFYHFMISFLTAVTVVLGMRMMGAMLISSFIIFPAMTARRLARSFKGMIFAAAGISLLSFACGMAASYLFDLPTGASVVCASLLFLLLSLPKRAKGA